MTSVLETRVDETFPEITVDLARLVFAAIEPELSGPVAALVETDAKEAWGQILRLCWDLPFGQLREVLGRLEQGEGPAARDALYAFTWAIYHSRVEDQIFGDED